MPTLKKTLPFIITLGACIFLLAPFQSFSVTDSANMLNVSVSMYELGDSSIAARANMETGEVVLIHSKYGLALPLLMQPFLFLNDILHRVSGSIDSIAVLSLVNPLVLALTAQVVFLTLVRLGYTWGVALFVSLLAVFGSSLYPYSSFFLSEPLQGLFTTSGFYFAVRAVHRDGAESVGLSSVLSGAALAGAALTKAACIPLIFFFFVYLVYSVNARDGMARTIRSAAFFLIPVAVYGAAVAYLNWSHFGSPLDFGDGGDAAAFSNPILRGLRDFLFNPSKSFLLYAPFTLLFPYALYRFGRTCGPEAALIGALFLFNLVFYSAWWAWEGGDSWGPRFILPLLPLAAVPVAELVYVRFFRWTAAALLAAGLLVNSLPVLQDPTGYNYIVLESTRGLDMETGRPRTDYLKKNGRLQIPPHVTTAVLPEFNVAGGHLWLLRARLKGVVEGYGMTDDNPDLERPPWIKGRPALAPPRIEMLPDEIRIRIECPAPPLFRAFTCKRSPSAPYYYDALVNQAAKAELMGLEGEAGRLRRKALREYDEARLRNRQLMVRERAPRTGR